jgi:hypothetical protein
MVTVFLQTQVIFVKYDRTDAMKRLLPFITTLYVLRPTRFDVCVGVVCSANIGYVCHIAA